MDKVLHHFETMGNRCLLVFAGESSFQYASCVVRNGFRPSTVSQGSVGDHLRRSERPARETRRDEGIGGHDDGLGAVEERVDGLLRHWLNTPGVKWS